MAPFLPETVVPAEIGDHAVSRGKVGGAAGLSRRAVLVKGPGRPDESTFRASCASLCAREGHSHHAARGRRGSPEAEKRGEGFERCEINSLCCGAFFAVIARRSLSGGGDDSCMQDYSLTGNEPEGNDRTTKRNYWHWAASIQDKIQKWKHKAEEAKEQGVGALQQQPVKKVAPTAPKPAWPGKPSDYGEET